MTPPVMPPPDPGQPPPPPEDPVERNKQRWEQIMAELTMMSQQIKAQVSANRAAVLDAHYNNVRNYIKGATV